MASREERKENRQRIKEIYEVAKKYNVSELISESRKPKDPSQGEYDEELDASGIRLALEELGSFYVQDRTLSEMILQRNLQSLGTTLLSPHLRKSRK